MLIQGDFNTSYLKFITEKSAIFKNIHHYAYFFSVIFNYSLSSIKYSETTVWQKPAVDSIVHNLMANNEQSERNIFNITNIFNSVKNVRSQIFYDVEGEYLNNYLKTIIKDKTPEQLMFNLYKVLTHSSRDLNRILTFHNVYLIFNKIALPVIDKYIKHIESFYPKGYLNIIDKYAISNHMKYDSYFIYSPIKNIFFNYLIYQELKRRKIDCCCFIEEINKQLGNTLGMMNYFYGNNKLKQNIEDKIEKLSRQNNFYNQEINNFRIFLRDKTDIFRDNS